MVAALITQEDVAQACRELVKAGESLSAVKVRKLLGDKGGYSTIQKFIKGWRESEEAREAKADQLPAVVQLPESFNEDAMLFLKKVFKLAQDEHAAKVEQIHQEREQAVAAAQADVQEAVDYAEELGNQAEKLKDDLAAEKMKVAQLEETVGVFKGQVVNLERERSELENDVDASAAQIEELAGVVSELEKQVALLTQERDMATRSMAEAKTEHAEIVVSLKADHEAKLADALTAIKTEHQRTTEALKAEYESRQAAALEAVKADHAQVLADVREAAVRSTQDLKDAHAEALADVRQQREDLAAKLDAERAVVAERNQALAKCESKVSALEQMVQAQQKEGGKS